jgi:hypothetical protein
LQATVLELVSTELGVASSTATTIISTNNLVGGGGVVLNNGGTVTNQANATITAVAEGVSIQGAAGSVTNAGTITSSSATGVFLQPVGDVTNLAEGGFQATFLAFSQMDRPGGTVINAGTIEGKRSDSSGVSGSFDSLTNQPAGRSAVLTTASPSFSHDHQRARCDDHRGYERNFRQWTLTNAGTIDATGANGNAISTGNITITSNTGAIQATNAGGRASSPVAPRR